MGRFQKNCVVCQLWQNNSLAVHLFMAVEQLKLYGFEGTFFQQSALSLLTSLPSAIVFSPFIVSLRSRHKSTLSSCSLRLLKSSPTLFKVSHFEQDVQIMLLLPPISIIIDCRSITNTTSPGWEDRGSRKSESVKEKRWERIALNTDCSSKKEKT